MQRHQASSLSEIVQSKPRPAVTECQKGVRIRARIRAFPKIKQPTSAFGEQCVVIPVAEMVEVDGDLRQWFPVNILNSRMKPRAAPSGPEY
jgi:imidazole glycerol phosphate synthase subunit HisF